MNTNSRDWQILASNPSRYLLIEKLSGAKLAINVVENDGMFMLRTEQYELSVLVDLYCMARWPIKHIPGVRLLRFSIRVGDS